MKLACLDQHRLVAHDHPPGEVAAAVKDEVKCFAAAEVAHERCAMPCPSRSAHVCAVGMGCGAGGTARSDGSPSTTKAVGCATAKSNSATPATRTSAPLTRRCGCSSNHMPAPMTTMLKTRSTRALVMAVTAFRYRPSRCRRYSRAGRPPGEPEFHWPHPNPRPAPIANSAELTRSGSRYRRARYPSARWPRFRPLPRERRASASRS